MIEFIRSLACALFVFPIASSLWAEDRVALVIGNATYEHVPALKNPGNDALDLSIALEGLGFSVTLGLDLSREQLRETVSEFGETAKDADVSMFFFAGHGFQVDGKNYLVPVDSPALDKIEDLETQMLPLDVVVTHLNASKGLKLVFLDACRDNPFGDRFSRKGLAEVDAPELDFMFVYATEPNKVAFDGDGRNSYFTEALLDNLYSSGLDVSEMMVPVRLDVIKKTGNQQIPWENSTRTSKFTFYDGPDLNSLESSLWQVIAEEDSIELVQFYVEQYPEGSYVEEANNRLQRGRARGLDNGASDRSADRLWQVAQRSRLQPLLNYYIQRYPDAPYRDKAEQLLLGLSVVDEHSPAQLCKRLATHPRDATATQPGVSFDRLRRSAVTAMQACAQAATVFPEQPSYLAMLARATLAAGDEDRAIQHFKTASRLGDLRARVSLARLTELGNGVKMDPAKALTLYRSAANAGSPDAMLNLAVGLLENQEDLAQFKEALILLQNAADAGSAEAIFNLGVLALEGKFAEQSAALSYFQWAAKYGEPKGFLASAIMLDEGRGVEKDPDRAAVMILRAVAVDDGGMFKSISETPQQWSNETLQAVQERLARATLFDGETNGQVTALLLDALQEWRNGGFTVQALE